MSTGAPYLSEHESPHTESTTPASTATEEEKKVLKQVEKMYSQAKRHRSRYDYNWMDNYKMFRGKQWQEVRPSYRHSEVVNLIFQSIQHSVPIISDIRPQFRFLPEEPSDYEFAQILEEVTESEWKRFNWQEVILEMLYDSHFYGTAFDGVYFNPKLDDGLGAAEIRSEDPFYCFPDPDAIDVNKKGRYFIVAEAVSVDVLKNEYPEKKDEIKSDILDLTAYGRTELEDVVYRAATNPATFIETTNQTGYPDRPMALKITCYWMCDDIHDEEKEEKGEKVYLQSKKYPNGRRTIITNGCILEDGPNPYNDGKFPLNRLVNYILPREFWGISEIENLRGPQRTLNKMISFALDVLTLMGNPIWVVDDTAQIDVDNLFNAPGLIVEKNKNGEIRREAGVQLQPYVLTMINMFQSYINGLAGTEDVSQGVAQPGIHAGTAIELLQEAAETRLRLKSRNLEATLSGTGEMYLSRVLQFYSAPKMFRITNNESVEKYFSFYVDTMSSEDGSSQRVARMREFTKNPSGKFVGSVEEKSVPIKGKFDVRVSMGSGLPFTKQEKTSKSFELFKLGVIDDEELLRAIDYPNWEAVSARMKEKKAAMAQQQAAQGGGP